MDKLKLIFDELEQIRKRGKGILYPEAVVSFALDEDTALHSHFEWDDSVAAHQWRLQQGRQLITYYVMECPGTDVETQVYVSLVKDRYAEGGYRSLAEVMSDEELRGLLLLDACAEFNVFRRKYGRLRELADVFSEMDVVEKKVKGKGKR